jgi:hypothetical protein
MFICQIRFSYTGVKRSGVSNSNPGILLPGIKSLGIVFALYYRIVVQKNNIVIPCRGPKISIQGASKYFRNNLLRLIFNFFYRFSKFILGT